jgi:8-oxo-dGTP pyrophosphatase MutT (NUDIX family)
MGDDAAAVQQSGRVPDHGPYRFGDALRERLVANLAAFPRRAAGLGLEAAHGLRAAAVAVTVVADAAGDGAFLLTRRASRLRAHAGQWALPGGRVDDGETVETAALRELEEEVNLRLGPDAVLGRLDDYRTRSGFVIAPVVVWGGTAPTLRPHPDEVFSVHRVALADLDRPGSPRFVRIPESDRPVVQLPLLDDLVHAPTAALLYQLREVAVHGRHTRVDHLEQPLFAWR